MSAIALPATGAVARNRPSIVWLMVRRNDCYLDQDLSLKGRCDLVSENVIVGVDFMSKLFCVSNSGILDIEFL